MSVKDWAEGDEALIIRTGEQGLPASVKASLRGLQRLGVLDDAMFLCVLEAALSVDPLALCATIHGGHVPPTENLRTDSTYIFGTAFCVPVQADNEHVGDVHVCLVTNSVSVTRRVKRGTAVDIVSWAHTALSAQEVFDYIDAPDAQERISNLQELLGTCADAIVHSDEPVHLHTLLDADHD